MSSRSNGFRGRLAVIVLGVVVSGAAVASARAAELAVVGGTGAPGASVAVTLRLTGSDTRAVNAGADIAFVSSSVSVAFENCSIASRLQTTHLLAGRLLPSGALNLEIVLLGTPVDPPPLGDGDLASCTFQILPGAPAGPSALTIQGPLLGDKEGAELPVSVSNGSIQIGGGPTPTATETPKPPTGTPGTPTRTPTRTTTRTVTETAAPTSTRTVGPSATVTQTVEPSGCAGDCDGNGNVTVDELIKGVNIALGTAGIELCPSFDTNESESVTVEELIKGVNNALSGCKQPGSTPTRTVSHGPSSTATRSQTPTASATATLTRTRTGTATRSVTPRPPVLHVSTTTGQAGNEVEFVATLETNGNVVAGTQNDLAFDSLRIPVVARLDGDPDCTVNAGLGADSLFGFQPPGCSGVACSGIRALVFGSPVAIPDGAELYRCTVRIAADAPAATYPLTVSGVVMSNPDGIGFPGASGTNGAVIVSAGVAGTPTPMPTAPF
jgi:hypothetical protein